MKWQTKTMMGVLAALAFGVASAADYAREPAPATAPAAGPVTSEKLDPHEWHGLVRHSEATLAAFRQTDPGLSRFLSGAAGYAVFPSVGKGAVGIGGAYGQGVLFEHGAPTGRSTVSQVTIGAQLGAQAYSEIVFLETPEALAQFKKGEYAMAAQVSAVAAASGASANARYAQGVAVFTLARGGLMAEASVGGQRFAFTPVEKLKVAARAAPLAKAK